MKTPEQLPLNFIIFPENHPQPDKSVEKAIVFKLDDFRINSKMPESQLLSIYATIHETVKHLIEK
ncbi:MAG: hypothetical protein EWV88_21850 [Microcystis wesenbergii Mw_MB_S_20031200_S109D]|uniref:Uncharacterized protein n=1 Tax=Microcystis wesenbergii Mw_MB_S_20031200_S109D TaxID=2486241 RepID=A0A552LC80_9CHRO|nr:MAG: hypothetical protein EWV88_21850 [Microcystis wesenbergii Mw_MB_S_20031200_S109D]